MSKNGVSAVFVPYQDKSPRTTEFVSFRIPVDIANWLREITKLVTRGHVAGCLCPACRARRELES